MRPYQKKLFELFEEFCPNPQWPTYPPYHVGPYLEQYFINYYKNSPLEKGRYFIPIHWSGCYINNRDQPLITLQKTLDSLDQELPYFTVSTHDDAPRESLPRNTVCYSAGGNAAGTPIPLIVSEIPKEYRTSAEKKILASFIGSANTHPLRVKMYQQFFNNSDFYFSQRSWSEKVSEDQFENFVNYTKSSYFGLAPRGYGKTSYRLYEIMQLGSVPVYISDDFWLPWIGDFDWDKAIIKCKPEDLDILDLTLQDCLYSGEYEDKLQYIRESYDKYFTIDSTTKKILKKVENEEINVRHSGL